MPSPDSLFSPVSSRIISEQETFRPGGSHSSWIGEIFRTARRQTLVFMAVFFIGLLLTAMVIGFAPRKYQSQAKLLIKVGRESVSLDPTVTTTGDTTNIHRTRENEVKTALEVMKSRQLVEEVVDAIGEQAILDGALPGAEKTKSGWIGSTVKPALSAVSGFLAELDPVPNRERAVRELRESLEIGNAKDASVVEVLYRAKSPELASLVTETWVQKCIDAHSRINSTPGSLKFFQEQKVELLQKLNAAREQFRSLKSQNDIVTIAGAQESLQEQITLAQSDLFQARASLAASEARLAAIAEIRDTTDVTMITEEATSNSSETTERMRDRLYALEIEERQLSSKLTDTHPALLAIREQLDEARRVFSNQEAEKSEVTQGMNPLHIAMSEQWASEQANLVAHRAEVAASEAIIEEQNARLKQLNSREAELANVERDVEVLESQFREQFAKYEQARLAVALEESRISNLSVVQPASLEFRPVTPNKKLCAILGFLGSLFAALGIVTIREGSRTWSLESTEQPAEVSPPTPAVPEESDTEESGRFSPSRSGRTVLPR